MRRFTLLWPLLVACSSSPTTPHAVVDIPAKPTPSATSAQAAPPAMNVTVAGAPASFSFDGDTAEWNLHTPQGTSKLAVAVNQDGVFVATELGHPSPDGFWLGIASVAPPMLQLATWEAGGLADPIDCVDPGHFNPDGIWLKDDVEGSRGEPPPNKPSDVQQCEVLRDKHNKREAVHRERFTKMLHIEPTRVQVLDKNRELIPLEGAKINWKPHANGAMAEISLPVSALPRLSEAPLKRLFVWSAPGNSAPPQGPPDDESKAFNLPNPVSFDPHANLRARVFDALQPPFYFANSREEAQYRWTGMSYDPADPLHIEWIHYGQSAQTVKTENELLYEKKATLGDIEVGHVRSFREGLAISKKGVIVDLVELPEGLRGIIVRDGEIHAISFTPSHHTMAYGALGPFWSVIAIGPNGDKRDPVQNAMADAFAPANKGGLGCATMGPLAVMKGVESASSSWDTFGWKGSCNSALGKDEPGFDVTWKWDAAKKQYVGKFSKLPPVARKK